MRPRRLAAASRAFGAAVLLGAGVFGLAGCALLPGVPSLLQGVAGGPERAVLSGTQVTLAEPNYRLVRTNVVGQSRGLKILFFITVQSPTHAEAFEDLYEKASLVPDRPHSLAHVVHESTQQNFLLFQLPRVTVRADVVEFVAPSALDAAPSQDGADEPGDPLREESEGSALPEGEAAP